MPRQKITEPQRRLHLRLPAELVEFFEGTVLLKAEESRIGYGWNSIVRECLEERRQRMLAAQIAATAEGYAQAE